MSNLSVFVISNSHGQDVKFTGELIASVESSSNNAHPWYSGSVGHRMELAVYRTKAGKWVCHRKQLTQWQGEKDVDTVKICQSTDELIEFFGHGWLSKKLFAKLPISTAQEID